MCHSGYSGWFETRKQETAADQDAQKKRSAVIDDMLSKANKEAAAPQPAAEPAKDTLPAK